MTNADEPEIRQATADQAEQLTELALRSKAHWGYSEEFIESCRDELTVHPERLSDDDYQCHVAFLDGQVAGFYSLEDVSEDEVELDALFVEPGRIGTGVGRVLMRHAIRQATQRGFQRLIVQGDPNATAFYQAAGAVKVGERKSGSITGRVLPVFEIDLAVEPL